MESLVNKIQSTFIGSGSGKKALLLGAGFVTKPTVEILAKEGVTVTVGTKQSRFFKLGTVTDNPSSLSNTFLRREAL